VTDAVHKKGSLMYAQLWHTGALSHPDFFAGTVPVRFGELPPRNANVTVHGFPIGGNELCVTAGVVSRIEVRTYTHSQRNLLAMQTDAAINPGNSGGPVFKDGEFDEWVELSYKNRYAGEVYLEMTYYSEAPPPVPALPTDMQSRGLHSRDSSHTGSFTKLKRRPLPQQPDMADRTPPPSRGFPRHPYEQLPPSTSHSTHSSFSQFGNHQSEYDPSYDYQHERQQSLGYDRGPFPDYQPHFDYSHSAPDSPTLGRRRSEASIRIPYYDIQPLQE